MSELPLYMLVGDVLVPIGVAEVVPTTEKHVKISGELDVFPGARLTFSRIVHWEEFIAYARALYPEGFIMTESNDNGSGGPTEDEKERIKDRVLKEWDKEKEEKKENESDGQ